MMKTAQQWKKEIIRKCKSAGTYQPFFDEVIVTLSEILEQKDLAMEQYIQTGRHPVVTHTNKAGATNLVKNPCLIMWADLNAQALTYWRDLGLTPKGYRALSGEKVIRDDDTNPLLSIITVMQEED